MFRYISMYSGFLSISSECVPTSETLPLLMNITMSECRTDIGVLSTIISVLSFRCPRMDLNTDVVVSGSISDDDSSNIMTFGS